MSDREQAIKLNQESKQFRDEALEALSESRELLNKTIRFNDQASANQRRIAFAVSSLLPKHLRNDFNLNEADIENTAAVSRGNVEEIQKREIFDIVHAINVLAMANADVIHVFTEFAPHINQFCVNVYGVSQDFITNPSTKPLIQELVFLADNEALEKLLSVESQLTELIIEAREASVTKAEVEA
ncbi:hypothetical protein AB4407_07685 [Vibrio sp. 10N.261.46.E11]|uniref:hypothetical protein n=1 Tax=Vibrio sp. 10N.261.46.E11 TaxID=3229662 RepID=UPI00355148D8